MYTKKYYEGKLENKVLVGRTKMINAHPSALTGKNLGIYKFPGKDGFVLSSESPWRAAKKISEVKNGYFKNTNKENLSLFDIGDGDYYLAPSTEEEKKVERRSLGFKTGSVTSSYYLYISALDFVEMTGMSFKEYNANKDEAPFFVMHIKVSDNEKFIKLSCPKKAPAGMKTAKKAFAEKYGKAFGFKANDSYEISFICKPVKDSSFCLPVAFIRAAGINPGDSLPVHYDEQKKSFTFEAPIELCSCCGKPIHSMGENSEKGLVCEKCSDSLPYLQAFLKEKVGVSLEQLLAAANTVNSEALLMKENTRMEERI